MRWSVILPIAGLALFTTVSYQSARVNHEIQRSPNRYYWWSSLRLDSDPLDRNPKPADRCQYAADHCANWQSGDRKIATGWTDRALVFSALPAFLAGFAISFGLGRQGTDEVLIFMIAMPVLLFGWYYGIGCLLDRLLLRCFSMLKKRPDDKSSELKIT